MIRLPAIALLVMVTVTAMADQQFDVHLRIDVESAERSIELFRGLSGSPSMIAGLRGSQIALATTGLLANRRLTTGDLEEALQAAKFNQTIADDIFRMEYGKKGVRELKELLDALKQRNFAGKVVSTVAQLFPADTKLSTSIPMYVVAFGHQNIDAFVRRVEWKGDTPIFVGERQGELTIVVNLSKAVSYGRTLDERFIGLLSVVAHEVFHAAFGVYKDQSPAWKQYYSTRRNYLDNLLDLTQNEGIAHYLSLIQRTGGRFTNDQLPKINSAFQEFNQAAARLRSRGISPAQAGELIRNSNSSMYWDSYGAITGMVIARQIDQSLGREALMETIANGPDDFYRKYTALMRRDGGLPELSPDLTALFGGR
ncbi:MAG: hypothetical protein OEV30_08310 [Ignavibacteria bacterium]|nr:hypothetical protein [Ignavibacteria bacterium]